MGMNLRDMMYGSPFINEFVNDYCLHSQSILGLEREESTKYPSRSVYPRLYTLVLII